MSILNSYVGLSTLSMHAGPRLEELDIRNRTLRPTEPEEFLASDITTYRLPGDDHSMVLQMETRAGERKTFRYHNPHVRLSSEHPMLGDGRTRLTFKYQEGMLQYRKPPDLKDIRFEPGGCALEA